MFRRLDCALRTVLLAASLIPLACSESSSQAGDGGEAGGANGGASGAGGSGAGGTGGSAGKAGAGGTGGGSGAAGGAAGSGGDAGTAGACSPVIEISNLNANDNPANVLSVELTFDTSAAASADVEVIEVASGDSFVISGDSTTSHRIDVVGLLADTEYELAIRVSDDEGCAGEATHTVTTSRLPADIPDISVPVSDPARVSPGWTLFVHDTIEAGTPSYIVGVDEQGRVVWYHRLTTEAQALAALPDGHIVYQSFQDGFIEVDAMSNVVAQVTPSDLGFDATHHDVELLPNGNFIGLAQELRSVPNLPDGLPPEWVVGDVVFEATRAGVVLDRWSVWDFLSPLDRFDEWAAHNAPDVLVRDWTHGDAVFHDERDDTFVVSMRNLDWVVKFRRTTPPELVWRLGEGGDLPLTAGEWHYAPHGAETLPNGNVVVFDAGFDRPGTELYSRAVEYAVDDTAADPAQWTAAQVWEFRDSTPFYSGYLGDTNVLENGNILITDAIRLQVPTADLNDPTNLKWYRIVEVTHDDSPEKILELVVRDVLRPGFQGYRTFSAIRVAPLGR